MSQKLPPPYIEGAISAQYGEELQIPYQLNYAVGLGDFIGIKAKLKSATGSAEITTIDAKDFSNGIAKFTSPILTIGSHYKIQLAFIATDRTVGNYSTIGVFKYTGQPIISLDARVGNSVGNLYTYNGTYTNNGDPTEKLYSRQFILSTEDGEILSDSGIVIDSSKNYYYTLEYTLQPFVKYKLEYKIITINNIECSVIKTIHLNDYYKDAYLKYCSILPELDYNNGRIIIDFNIAKNANTNQKGSALFVLTRASNIDNYSQFIPIKTFKWNEFSNDTTWIDYTIEQGIIYKYALHRMNEQGFCSDKIISDEILSDFEDMFLFDGKKQLKIRFNPKVTSFKNTIQETKVDTIGGHYPFVFRNNDICYKEFPIGGMISHLSDRDELFLTSEELGFTEESAHRHASPHKTELSSAVRGTQLDTANIIAERTFKLKVLEWLTNGETKIFRSPTEGNYIVRLMNVSLSPNDTLNRMIHSFTANAYEMGPYDSETLKKYNLIDLQNPTGRFSDNVKYLKVSLRNDEYVGPLEIDTTNMGRIWRAEYNRNGIKINGENIEKLTSSQKYLGENDSVKLLYEYIEEVQ